MCGDGGYGQLRQQLVAKVGAAAKKAQAKVCTCDFLSDLQMLCYG